MSEPAAVQAQGLRPFAWLLQKKELASFRFWYILLFGKLLWFSGQRKERRFHK